MMVPEPNRDELITRYLLEELAEPEREHMIDRYLGDHEFFERVLAVEEELIDDYARGQLPPPARARFERYYLSTPERRDRVKHAKAFSQALAPGRAAPGWRSRLGLFLAPSPALNYALATAAALIFVGAVWLAAETVRLRGRVRQLQAGQAAPARRVEELTNQVAEERGRSARLAEELQRLQDQTAAEQASWQRREQELQRRLGRPRPPDVGDDLIASFELPAGEVVVRGRARTLAVKAGADLVTLQLNLQGDDYHSYRVTLRTHTGEEIISQSGLKAQTTKSGRAVVLSFAARQVATGDYVLTLIGVTDAGTARDVDQWPVRIQRS